MNELPRNWKRNIDANALQSPRGDAFDSRGTTGQVLRCFSYPAVRIPRFGGARAAAEGLAEKRFFATYQSEG
jgi:hypothetical protein